MVESILITLIIILAVATWTLKSEQIKRRKGRNGKDFTYRILHLKMISSHNEEVIKVLLVESRCSSWYWYKKGEKVENDQRKYFGLNENKCYEFEYLNMEQIENIDVFKFEDYSSQAVI